MKKLLAAFTLAEVLITLAIIGVVARVTLPALFTNVNKQQAAASLLKAINTIEIANETILSTTEAQTLKDALVPESTYHGTLGIEYLSNMSQYMKGDYEVKAMTVNNKEVKQCPTFVTKDGLTLMLKDAKGYIYPVTTENAPLYPSQYKGTYFQLVVDVNGEAKPNKYGHDQFVLLVDEYGAVIPKGSYAYTLYSTPSNYAKAQTTEIKALWETTCSASSCTTPENAAGSIVDNGGKIIYKI